MLGEIGIVQVMLTALQREQLLDEVRHGDHGRSHVKREAIDLLHERTSTWTVELLNDGGVEAKALQANAQRKPADARADDDRLHGCVLNDTAAL